MTEVGGESTAGAPRANRGIQKTDHDEASFLFFFIAMKPLLRTIIIMKLLLFSTFLLAASSVVVVRPSPPLVSSWHGLTSNDVNDAADEPVMERIGTYKILAVRVTTAFGQEPQESLQEIEGAVFGTGAGAVVNSVVRQFDAITHGQLRYIPAVGTNGVVEIQMDQEILYYIDSEQDLINATEALFGGARLSTVADRTLFCMPDGTLGEGVWGLAEFPGRVRDNPTSQFATN
jgi:hypothetical protein